MNDVRREWIINWPNLEGLIAERNSFRLLISGKTSAWLEFDASRGELAVEIEQSESSLPKVLPQAISLRIRRDNGGKILLVLSTINPELRRYFYDFSVEVLELALQGGLAPCAAVDEAWKRWGELIEQQSVLSRERQVGLIGELLLLRRIANANSWRFALDAWHSTARAEHDFCLEHCDIEVKSTTSDRRVHTIGSIDQLLPSPDRPLLLLSNQFAVAPQLAKHSFSLASIVNLTIRDLENTSGLLDIFKERLGKTGYRANHVDYYQATFVVRGPALLIFVDDNCPRIIPKMLTDFLGAASSRIETLMYSIDVTGLGWEDGSPEFLGYIP